MNAPRENESRDALAGLEPERILLVRLSSVGDLILASPVAQWLRERYPSAEISWLVDQGYDHLVSGNPHVDRVVQFEFTGRHRGPAGIRNLAQELAPVDLLVDLQHKVRTTLLNRWLKPQRRVVMIKRRGMDLVRAMVGRDTILRGPHQISRYLKVLGVPPVEHEQLQPFLAADEAQRTRAAHRLSEVCAERPIVGVIPKARHWTKGWPLEHVEQLARLCLEAGLGLALLGGKDDALLVEGLARRVDREGLFLHAGGDLAQLAAVISCCSVVVSPDSGPAHMAAALGIPLIALFGPTSPERWAPRGPEVNVLHQSLACSPCSNHGSATCPLGTLECMRALEPELVFGNVCRMLELEGDP